MRKILFHLNSLGKGGAERVVSLLSGEFAKEGYDVVIATEWAEEDEYILHPSVKRVNVGLSDTEEGKSRLAKQWIRIKKLRERIKDEKPDVVISFCVKANYRAMMATIGTKIPVIISVRNDPKIDYVGTKNRIMNLLLNKAVGCVFQTKEAKEFFSKTLQKKSAIICNPVNEKYLITKRKEATNKIVTVGRLVKQKNQMLLVKAFEKLLNVHPEYELFLYGDGSLDECKKQLQQYVEGSDVLAGKVHFCGLSSTLEEDMADAKMFVLPSDYEGMPNALMEAMALGLPVISTDCPCGGSRYWIDDKQTGLLTPVGDLDELLKAMLFYIDNPSEADRIGNNARKRLDEARLDKVYAQWKSYLNEVL